jgi:hypothetical protein
MVVVAFSLHFFSIGTTAANPTLSFIRLRLSLQDGMGSYD